MKTFEEIIKDVQDGDENPYDYHRYNLLADSRVIIICKEAHDQAVDLCLKNAKLLKGTNFEGSCILDKESILKVKNMLNNEK